MCVLIALGSGFAYILLLYKMTLIALCVCFSLFENVMIFFIVSSGFENYN